MSIIMYIFMVFIVNIICGLLLYWSHILHEYINKKKSFDNKNYFSF